MRILRVRPGFQADHSSSSYLFYASDRPVSAAGQRVAHRFSSRADVDEQFARYEKWGESSLSPAAFPALLGEHYDVMASESYDSWTLMIAVPKTPQMTALLRPFHDLDDGEFTRLDVHNYGKRLVIEIFCEFDYAGPLVTKGSDMHEDLVELLATIRAEIMQGDVSFLEAVAEFYGVGAEEESTEKDEKALPPELPEDWTRDELQKECVRRGVPFRKSWSKDRLRQALSGRPAPAGPTRGRKPTKLSPAARRIVASLDHR